MTNMEKIKNELDILDVWNIMRSGTTKFNCDFIKENILQIDNCRIMKCIRCKKKVLEWLKKRYIDTTMTEDEYNLLLHLPKLWKYIARNKNGELYLFNHKPTYSTKWGEWYLEYPQQEITFVKNRAKIYRRAEITCIYGDYIFPFIKCEDNFWKISDLIKMGEEAYEISSDVE